VKYKGWAVKLRLMPVPAKRFDRVEIRKELSLVLEKDGDFKRLEDYLFDGWAILSDGNGYLLIEGVPLGVYFDPPPVPHDFVLPPALVEAIAKKVTADEKSTEGWARKSCRQIAYYDEGDGFRGQKNPIYEENEWWEHPEKGVSQKAPGRFLNLNYEIEMARQEAWRLKNARKLKAKAEKQWLAIYGSCLDAAIESPSWAEWQAKRMQIFQQEISREQDRYEKESTARKQWIESMTGALPEGGNYILYFEEGSCPAAYLRKKPQGLVPVNLARFSNRREVEEYFQSLTPTGKPKPKKKSKEQSLPAALALEERGQAPLSLEQTPDASAAGSFCPGSRVCHSKFGDGTVRTALDATAIAVCFEGVGLKILDPKELSPLSP